MSALERCVGDARAFAERYWATKPLLFKRPSGGALAFEDLASLGDFDHMVSSLGLKLPSFRMVKDGKPLPPASYTRTERNRTRSIEGVIDPAAVYERFADGATIVLESVHKYWRPVTSFSRELEMDLGHRIQVNAYITPPGSQGFAVHTDDHDVFVLQTAGSKRWSVMDRDDPSVEIVQDELRFGDVLYIPKGFPHSATTTANTSAHLTVGILTHDAIDIAREVVKLAEEEPTFQERLPLRPAADEAALKETIAQHLDDLKNWIDKVDRDELAWRVTRRLLGTRQELLVGQLEQLALADSLTEGASLRQRPGSICVVNATSGALRVLLADRELEMPLALRETMEFVAATPSFTARDLGHWLDAESALVLVKRLVREGLLEVLVAG
jgi:lysine-specific demethylase/histidyl-hydroxylase NO66